MAESPPPAYADETVPVPLRLQVTALDDPQARAFRYEFDLDRSQILLGRRGGVDVLLPDAKVSLVHARIERKKGEFFLVDDGSTNGTRLNGAPVPFGARQRLREGDRIVIGAFSLVVSLSGSAEIRADSSISMARSLVRDLLERLGPGESQPSLEVLDGPQTGVVLALGDLGRTYIIGRAAGDDLRLDDVDMWREHAALVRDELGVTARSVAAHTLLINDEPLAGARQLHDGDLVVLGATAMRYHDPAEVYLRKLESDTPDEAATAVTPAPPPPPRPRGSELALVLLGVVAMLVALGGLAYVLLW